MLVTTLLSAAFVLSPQAKPIEFHRVFVKGEKATYEVHSTLNAEIRQAELDTWIPEDLDLIYRFNYEVTAMKPDGICVMRYKRPTMTQIEGETVDKPPVTKVEKTNLDFELTLSPINEILDMKDMTPAKKPKAGGLLSFQPRGVGAAQLQSFLGQFTGQIYQLALCVGSLDASLDFSPPLSVNEVAPGDTWKKTVGFSPQKLASKGGKLAVQRMDYVYTYKGQQQVNGQTILRVDADLTLKTDLGAFIHQTFNVKPEQTGLKEIPMQMTAKLEFDLDPKTHRTIRAMSRSTGGFSVVTIANPNKAEHEERFKAQSVLRWIPGAGAGR